MVTVGRIVALSHVPRALPLELGGVAFHIHPALPLSLEFVCLEMDFLPVLCL